MAKLAAILTAIVLLATLAYVLIRIVNSDYDSDKEI